MGSVADDYLCPWCGRRGNGGYAMDGVDAGPICTDGNYSCLWFKAVQGLDLKEVRELQLRTILLRLSPGDFFVAQGVIEKVAAFIGPKEDDMEFDVDTPTEPDSEMEIE